MATLRPAYLIHGEDHGAIAERRANLKALAERQAGPAAVEILTGEAASPQGVSLALSSMTFAIGGGEPGGVGRVIIVDGVERWKQAEVEKHLKPAMAPMPPETTLALFAREEGRSKAPAGVHDAVKAAGGQVVVHATVKPWELPRWARTEGKRLGLELDVAAAKALVAQVGERQQRLLRELEKIALELRPEGTATVSVGAEEVEARASASAQRKAFALGDALLAGDAEGALKTYIELEGQGESLSGLIYLIASRLREALAVAQRLAEGESASAISRSLRMPPKAAQRLVAAMEHADQAALKRALGTLSDLELDLRGGERLMPRSRASSGLSERTLALQTIASITG
ncbi:MAG TPA: DNA polymerase III subunit delta [Solirubrobacteraceae bacterium]|jgi:DNA polymerase-3 subunit delta